MWFVQPSARPHTELPFLNKASLPQGRCLGDALSCRVGFRVCSLAEGPQYQSLLLLLKVVLWLLWLLLLPAWNGGFQPLEDSRVRRNAQIWENLAHSPGHCLVPCVLPEASRISCFPSLRCNFTFRGQVFSAPGNLEVSIPDFCKDSERYSMGL